MTGRTDLAAEAQELWRRSAGENTALPGVRARSWQRRGICLQKVEILNDEGRRALGKPEGNYVTLEAPELDRAAQDAAEILAETIGTMLDLSPGEKVLVVGLGNREVTPDRIGPDTADRVFVTAHLPERAPEIFGDIRPVCALAPGVLASTGMESADIVSGVISREKPDKVIVVDALAAAERKRLCRSVQVTDAGIVPGSGVGNSRAAFSQKTLGVPVCAVGVPTVLDAGDGGESLMVTPRDIDERVRRFSVLLSMGINRALFPDWADDEIAQLRE